MDLTMKAKKTKKTKEPYCKKICTERNELSITQKRELTPEEIESEIQSAIQELKKSTAETQDLEQQNVENTEVIYVQSEDINQPDPKPECEEKTAKQEPTKNVKEREVKKMEHTALGSNCYLREFSEDIYYLQKGEHTIRLLKPELKQLMDLKPCISVCMKDYLHGKKVKFTQNLGQDIYVSLQTPYRCIDVRKFWIVPGTEQLHPTRIGIPLNFTEYFNLIRVLEEKELA